MSPAPFLVVLYPPFLRVLIPPSAETCWNGNEVLRTGAFSEAIGPDAKVRYGGNEQSSGQTELRACTGEDDRRSRRERELYGITGDQLYPTNDKNG